MSSPRFKQMSLKLLYEQERRWASKIAIMDMFHLSKKAKDAKWTIQNTADYFRVSKALVSENLKLAANLDSLDHCGSREKALIFLRSMNEHAGNNHNVKE